LRKWGHLLTFYAALEATPSIPFLNADNSSGAFVTSQVALMQTVDELDTTLTKLIKLAERELAKGDTRTVDQIYLRLLDGVMQCSRLDVKAQLNALSKMASLLMD